MTDTRVVLMTVPDASVAEALTAELVQSRLAACASVVRGVTSVFWWQGEVRRADEVMVIMKTSADRVDALIARATELHPYDVPELLALPVEAGLAPYLDWVRAESRVGGSD